MHDTRFADGVACILDNAQIGFRPDLFQVPGIEERSAHVVAPMHDDARNVADQMCIAQKVVIRIEEALVLEIVAFDTGESDGKMVRGKSFGACRIRQQ